MVGLKTYEIRKNKHYSGFRFCPFIRCKEITIAVKFTDSCRYISDDLQLTEQINKLVGFGAIRHHRNSVRIGWRYNQAKDLIQLYIYEYKKGERLEPVLFESARIGQTKKLTLKSKKLYWFGKFLWPYFGGKAKSPHDIKIKMTFL